MNGSTRYEFAVVPERLGDTARLIVTGEMDMSVVDALERAVAQFDLRTAEKLEVDLTGVTFADSTAVAWLIEAERSAREAGAHMELVVANGPVEYLLSLTGIEEHIAVRRPPRRAAG
jgi:anti-anti-sigma factor